MKIATGAAGDDIQIIGKARDVLLEAVARASGQPYIRIHVGRG